MEPGAPASTDGALLRDGSPGPIGSGGILAPGNAAAGTSAQPAKFAPLATTAVASVLAGPSLTYQGMLRSAGAPLNATCDLQFSLWDDAAAGTQIGATQTVTTTIVNGLFTVTLNDAGQFGSTAFDGRALWVAIAVRSPSGTGSYTPLTPRQALTAAPLAAGLVPHTTTSAGDSYSGYPVQSITAPAVLASNPMGLMVSAGPHSSWSWSGTSVGIWGDSGSGAALWGTTDTGWAVTGSSSGSGWAGYFQGGLYVSGKLQVPHFHSLIAINSAGPMPITSASFSTYGGTLVISYSGSGYSSVNGIMIGMVVKVDGVAFDQTAIYANALGTHLAFVPKQWVLTGIAAGSHTISLTPMAGTSTDYNDIFNVVVTELPY